MGFLSGHQQDLSCLHQPETEAHRRSVCLGLFFAGREERQARGMPRAEATTGIFLDRNADF